MGSGELHLIALGTDNRESVGRDRSLCTSTTLQLGELYNTGVKGLTSETHSIYMIRKIVCGSSPPPMLSGHITPADAKGDQD